MTGELFSQGNITRLLTASDLPRSHPSHCNFKPQMPRTFRRVLPLVARGNVARSLTPHNKEGS
ncbi:MAG: hypothetical protein QOD28_3934 [Acidobacteriota bacterium]|nr:hypothetical protein [Acidobacteriota bacterium]